MNELIVTVLYTLLIFAYLYPIVLIVKNQKLSSRRRANFSRPVCVLPFVGSLSYILWLRFNRTAKFKRAVA